MSGRGKGGNGLGKGGAIPMFSTYTQYNEYGFKRHRFVFQDNTQGITNFLRQYVQPSDLDKFFTMFVDEDPKATPPTPSKIVGANNPSDPGTEAMLDAEYLVR